MRCFLLAAHEKCDSVDRAIDCSWFHGGWEREQEPFRVGVAVDQGPLPRLVRGRWLGEGALAFAFQARELPLHPNPPRQR
jgi:hypothetical protein